MKYTPEERIKLIDEWSTFFYDTTEGWFPDVAGGLGAELAYLFVAMAKGTTCVFQQDDEIIQHLFAHVGAPSSDDTIWDFITIEDWD